MRRARGSLQNIVLQLQEASVELTARPFVHYTCDMTALVSKRHDFTRADDEGVTGACSLQNALVQLQEANAKAEGLAGVVAIRQDECRHYQEQAGPLLPYPILTLCPIAPSHM